VVVGTTVRVHPRIDFLLALAYVNH
jgi:hypothetical protein